MLLLLIRHARAEKIPAATADEEDDAARALTAEGCRRMRRAAAGLAAQIRHIDVLAASPLKRAVQTADIIAAAYPGLRTTLNDLLVPGSPSANLLAWVARHPPQFTIALVGHEPDLREFASRLLTAHNHRFMAFKKGAISAIEMPEPVRAGQGKLMWYMTAAQLGNQRQARD